MNQLEFGWDEEPTQQRVLSRAECDVKEVPLLPPNPRKAQADTLHADLKRRTGLVIQLTITDNVSTIMSVRLTKPKNFARVRLHHLFLESPENVREALATWISKPKARSSGDVIDDYIKTQRDKIRTRAPKAARCITAGNFHDLQALYDDVNRSEFEGAVDCPITWGKMPRLSRTRRSIRFGSYTPQDHLIRIHPLLDQAFVPSFLVRYIVFHEMLHAEMGIRELPGGRRAIHPPEFRLRESRYRDYDIACEWIDNPANLKKLLTRYRHGRA